MYDDEDFLDCCCGGCESAKRVCLTCKCAFCKCCCKVNVKKFLAKHKLPKEWEKKIFRITTPHLKNEGILLYIDLSDFLTEGFFLSSKKEEELIEWLKLSQKVLKISEDYK